MKKYVFLVLGLFVVLSVRVCAEEGEIFGELSWESNDYLMFYSDGGSGNADIFGFEISDGKFRHLLPQIGAKFSDNVCIKITGINDGDFKLRRFAKTGETFVYSDEVYIHAEGGKFLVMTRCEKVLYDSKTIAKAQLSSYISERSAYRDEELALIDEIIGRYIALIDDAVSSVDAEKLCADGKAELDSLHKKEWFDKNAQDNEEVLLYLNNAYTQISAIKFTGKGKKIINIVLPVVKVVIEEGTKGEILITDDYINIAYAEEIAEAKGIYSSMNDTERSYFYEKILELDAETREFLENFFN